MISAAHQELDAAGVTESPEVVVADTGYWHQAQMENVVNRGIQVPTNPARCRQAQGHPARLGRRTLGVHAPGAGDRPRQSALPKRQTTVEPVFAHTKFNQRIDRFQRARSACRSEWRLITATHNLLKLRKHQMAAAAA